MSLGYTLKLDADGEIVFNTETQRHDLASEAACLSQDLRVRLLTFEGDDPVHPTVGLPYISILAEGYDRVRFENAVREEIAEDPRVLRVTSVTSSKDGRKATASAEGVAVDGTTFDLNALTVAT